MVTSNAATVTEYLQALPDDRRKVIAKVRSVIRKHLPTGYEEAINWGAITYQVPLKRYPDTYNGQPLCYVALAAQKNFNTLYLMAPYADPQQLEFLKDSFAKAGKKLNMGGDRFETCPRSPSDPSKICRFRLSGSSSPAPRRTNGLLRPKRPESGRIRESAHDGVPAARARRA